MSYFAFVHSKSGLTQPVFIAEYRRAKSSSDAYESAVKDPGVRKIVGQQHTGDLHVMVHEAQSLEAAKAYAKMIRCYGVV